MPQGSVWLAGYELRATMPSLPPFPSLLFSALPCPVLFASLSPTICPLTAPLLLPCMCPRLPSSRPTGCMNEGCERSLCLSCLSCLSVAAVHKTAVHCICPRGPRLNARCYLSVTCSNFTICRFVARSRYNN